MPIREERTVIGEGTAYPLNGILTLPAEAPAPEAASTPSEAAPAGATPATPTANAPAPFPAVVFVHGSGSSNMDEKIGGLTPFKDLAEGLARHGIASIRYDKRSFAHGFKMMKDKSLIITVKEETIDDAVLAAEMLRNDPRIDSGNIFVIGHSMGGMLAPRIDAEGGNFKGLIIMAGTPRKLEEVMIEQTDEALSDMNAIMRLLAGGPIKKTIAAFDGMYDLTDVEAKKKKVGGGTTLYYFTEMGRHAAPDYLAATKKPLLIMQGAKDFQVKVDKDFGAYQKLLGDRPNVTFKLYEGLNHAFVPAIYDDINQAKKEYAAERHIGEGVISDIATWIKGVSA